MSTFSYGYLSAWFNAYPHVPHRSFRLTCTKDNLLERIPRFILLSLFSVALSTFPIASAQQGLQVDLYTLDSIFGPQQCGSVTFAWSGGVPPYVFSIETGSDDTVWKPFGWNWSQHTTWTWDPVAVAGGTIILAQVKDSTHQEMSMPEFVVQNSTNDGCLGMGTLASPRATTPGTTSGHSTSATTSVPMSSLSAATTSAPSIPSSSSSQAGRLSTATIAHITVGIAGIILLSAGVFLCVRRRRRANQGAAVGLLHWVRKYFGSSDSSRVERSVADPEATHVWPFIDIHGGGDQPHVDTSEVQTQTNSSLEARASSMDSPALDHAARLSDTHGRLRNMGGRSQSEKLLRELRSRAGHASAVSGAGNEQGDVVIDDSTSSGHGIEHIRHPRYETDGGVRLAGGRAGEDLVDGFDRHSTYDGSALPPPYSSHFGGT